MRRLWRQTIWARDAIPLNERKYRSLKRIWLPIVDLLYILGGLSAARYGVPAINEFFTDEVVCLVGVAFVRLWWLEIAGKCVLLGQMATYVTALVILTRAGDDQRGFVFVIATIATVPLLIRLTIVADEWADRRAAKSEASTDE